MVRLAMFAGTAAVVVGLSRYHAQLNDYDYEGSFRLAWSVAFILLLNLVAYGAGLPDLARTPVRAVSMASGAVVAAALGVSVLQLFLGDALLPRLVVFGSLPLLIPWYAFCAWLGSRDRSRGEGRARVLLLADVHDGDELANELAKGAEQPAVLVAVVPPEDVLSTPEDPRPLERVVEREAINVIVLGPRAVVEERILHQVASLHGSGIRVRTLSLFYEQWLGKLPVAELERVSLLFDISELHRSVYGRVSRVTDVAVGLVGLAILVLVVPLVWLGNLAGNRGPLFYSQLRVGKNHSTFRILKFRTMRPLGGGTLVNEWTAADDPRITPFGRVLRTSHLDELPQMVNILRGDLSVVGPRPEQPHYVEQLVEKLPFYDLRHLVRPGLTGWAQVKYGYAGSEEDAVQKLQYEFFYLRHQSFRFDVAIMARTIRSVVGRRGR
jgi:lipopolysaccharide/colanic/teichoic acid biosynthesis glycosyltransferase